ncbi:Hypothetical predicted protein [Xyrichtys novacula]|uniref:Uncharacterized protein n=1 Tax=Xyrichtys novacula TaxID=13765 RepID=A0AAV1EI74_XYRNO|nr:Hypothetical predicted protein [Xyrichtys novacula]
MKSAASISQTQRFRHENGSGVEKAYCSVIFPKARLGLDQKAASCFDSGSDFVLRSQQANWCAGSVMMDRGILDGGTEADMSSRDDQEEP